MEAPIPFNHTLLAGDEIAYMEQSVKSGHLAAAGPFSQRAAALLRETLGASEVFLTTSCTDALEMGALLLGLKPGDVAILPSFTFVSTALALARSGAKILFADIQRETLGLDPQHVSELMNDRVRVIVPVHYAGVGCDMAALSKLTEGKKVDLFEDNAQGLFGTYQGKPLGSFGRLSAISFHETKNISCGEGGALLINRASDVSRAHVLYDKGTNRQAFLSGEVDKYTWVDEGSSFGMSDILAAHLLAQLEKRDKIQSRRKEIWNLYLKLLAPEASRLGFSVPSIPPGREHSYHMFHLLVDNPKTRDRVLGELRKRGIQAAFHFTPLHSALGAKPHLERPTNCPVTDDISGRLLRLPFHNALTDDQVRRVAENLLEVLQTS